MDQSKRKHAVVFAILLCLIGLLTAVSVGEYMIIKNKDAQMQAEAADGSEEVTKEEKEDSGLLEQLAGKVKTEKKEENGQKEEKTDPSQDGVTAHGALHLEGTQIVDEHGRPTRLRGMSSHGMMWYPQYTNYSAIKTTADYGANVFRIAMYSEEPYTGYNVNKEINTGVMYAAIENVKAADLYAIVDWHVLEDANPLNHMEEAKGFFEEISAHYGNDPGILYEICNEPNGDTTWDDIYEYAGQVIPIIRSHAPDALIIVGTTDYSYGFNTSLYSKPLEFDNVMYAFHYYAGLHNDDYENIITDALAGGLPVFVSEWGMDTDKTEEALEEGRKFADFLRKNQISFAAWSLSNKQECFSAIRSDCNKLCGWTKEDLTPVGEILFDALAEE